MKDPRPPEYLYWNQLQEHLTNVNGVIKDTDMVYPRQFEIHLPGNHLQPCNLNCPYCAGSLFDKSMGTWEMEGLELLDKLQGAIQYHIYGGAYSEPLLNPYFMSYLAMTKKHGNHFGIHTNGTYLSELEEHYGWLSELNRLATDKIDYLSISLDAGERISWAKTKGTRNIWQYDMILQGVKKAVDIRNEKGNGHAIRLCYLISKHSDNDENIRAIYDFVKDVGVDSLRFSIPFANYNQTFDKVRRYKESREIPSDLDYKHRLQPYLSQSMDEKPYIFYTGPEYTDIDKFNFHECVYSYYQITHGADGYVYRCSTTATPTMKFCRLGKVTSDLDEFLAMIKKSQLGEWDAETCFKHGARCNRMGLEINCAYMELGKDRQGDSLQEHEAQDRILS